MMQIGLREGGSASGERDLRLQASTWPPSAAVRPSAPSVGEDPGLSQRRLAGWAKVLGEALGLAEALKPAGEAELAGLEGVFQRREDDPAEVA